MLRSCSLGRRMNLRRIPLTLGAAVGAAFAAALIGLANAPAARADTEPEPFQYLFGDSGINTWTPSADSLLNSSDPTLAGNWDTSGDNFLLNMGNQEDEGSSDDALQVGPKRAPRKTIEPVPFLRISGRFVYHAWRTGRRNWLTPFGNLEFTY